MFDRNALSLVVTVILGAVLCTPGEALSFAKPECFQVTIEEGVSKQVDNAFNGFFGSKLALVQALERWQLHDIDGANSKLGEARDRLQKTKAMFEKLQGDWMQKAMKIDKRSAFYQAASRILGKAGHNVPSRYSDIIGIVVIEVEKAQADLIQKEFKEQPKDRELTWKILERTQQISNVAMAITSLAGELRENE